MKELKMHDMENERMENVRHEKIENAHTGK